MRVKPIQIGLPLEIKGDAFASTTTTESPVGKEQLMELILRSENLQRALKRVKQNKGAAGVDQMGTEQLHDYLKQHWATFKHQLLEGTYQPQPVRRVEIPKPGGGKRLLGIPTVLDRFIQQAMLQILQDQWDETLRSSATDSALAATLIKPSGKPSSTCRTATAGWWISIWRSSSTASTTTS